MLNDLDKKFYAHLSRIQRLYARSLAKRLASHGVKPGYIDILDRLWQRDNVTQKALHSTLDIEQATLSNTLKRMERDNILSRVRNPQDKRMTYIVLTEHGRGLHKVVNASLDDVQATASMGLTVNDRRYFYRILRQMTEHLEADLDETALILVDEVQE